MLEDLESNLESKKQASLASGESPTKGGAVTLKAKDIIIQTPFVQNLMKFLSQFESMNKNCFNNSTHFRGAIRDAFEVFLNRDILNVSIAEILAVHTDKLLQKGNKMTEEEIEQEMDDIVKLFSFLIDKDYFVDTYKVKLARRLLNDRI